jgi:hypothetical protein
MKQTLLLLFFLCGSVMLFSQSSNSFSERYKLLSQQSTAELIQIFPNPATDYIQLSNSEDVKKIVIINMVGRRLRVFEAIEDQKLYRIGDLPRGMYLVQIIGDKNKIITTKRVKKQ